MRLPKGPFQGAPLGRRGKCRRSPAPGSPSAAPAGCGPGRGELQGARLGAAPAWPGRAGGAAAHRPRPGRIRSRRSALPAAPLVARLLRRAGRCHIVASPGRGRGRRGPRRARRRRRRRQGGPGPRRAAGRGSLAAWLLRAKMAAPLASKPGAPGAPSKPAGPELDFRSGARSEELNRLIQEFARHEQREYDDQRALEIHTAKDFIFSMLGMVQKLDQKLPVANEYLLLSGGVREGVVDLDLDELNVYARGTDYDMDFTLLVPALKLHDRNQPVTLDMRHSALCHSWLSLRLFDEGTISKWKDCCTIVDHINGATNYFFSPTKVADWFYDSISIVLSEIQKKPQRGMPKVEKVEKNGTIISVILGVGSSRMLYDIVPVVSFKGWPAVAQSWLMENHFWDGKITEEEVISGFYLVPACSYKGKKDNEWRLSFARSEVQLKKCISSSLMQAYQACKAIIIKLLSRPKAISPYHLRSMMLWACDRLPASYLAQEDYAAHFLLGLIDDLQHCLVNKMCPNYFIPQCNMLEHLSEETVMLHARKLSSVRSDPAEHLRTAIEHVKAANRLTLELQRRGSTSSIPSPQSDGGDPNQPDDRLAKKLQQLVTENPGKSISVFINPDDVTRPHFRIDDKFF
ncbi:nucleotidyltransferase MB21D2 [Pelodiscus sinensis]|uniref:nucleotidyltransferase MB21D2 n=1 Tax=Pelodiscus sinensis TaxID=13735 RepID=UPI003F6C641F